MTCHDARELFSAEIDGALGADEAAGLQAHLAGCPECRRELARFRATVAVLQSVEPLRAPAGFVDRVLEAARPPSWAERLRRRLVAPLALGRPIAVTVTLLVAVTAVYLYERTPELQRGFEVAKPVEQEARRSAAPAAPAAPALQAPPPSRDVPAKESAPAHLRGAVRPGKAGSVAEPEPARDKAPASDEKKAAADYHADAFREAQTRLDEEKQRQLRTAQTPASEGERAERAASGAPAASPPPSARAKATPEAMTKSSAVTGRLAALADVEGRLGVADRAAARRALVDLATRLGGTAVPAPADARGDVVELVVPAAGYPELVAGLARLGRWAPVREPAELPGQVRVTLLLTD